MDYRLPDQLVSDFDGAQRNFEALQGELSSVAQARVKRTAAFVHNVNGGYLAVPFDAEDYDLGASAEQHSTAANTSRLVCQKPGLYAITGCVEWVANAAGHRRAEILHSGGSIIAGDWGSDPQAGVGLVHNVAGDWRMALGEYVELRALQNSGGNLNIGNAYTFLGWHRIGP